MEQILILQQEFVSTNLMLPKVPSSSFVDCNQKGRIYYYYYCYYYYSSVLAHLAIMEVDIFVDMVIDIIFHVLSKYQEILLLRIEQLMLLRPLVSNKNFDVVVPSDVHIDH